MNNVYIYRVGKVEAEYFEGVVGFNAGTTAVQLTTFDGKCTVLVLEAGNIERIDMEPIYDDDIEGQTDEFKAWHTKQMELAIENTKLQKASETIQ